MCAYNVRQRQTLDHDPATGPDRRRDRLRELGLWLFGATALYLVYWVARRILF